MLCCFGRPASGQKSISSPRSESLGHVVDVIEDEAACSSESSKSVFLSEQAVQQQRGPVFGHQHEVEEPWRSRLSERLATWVSRNGLRAAGCWVCAKDREKCALVAAAPSATGNVLRSALQGFFIGSVIDLSDKSSSVAYAISTKALVSGVVLANGQVLGDLPVDLRQLYERLCRTFASLRAGHSSTVRMSAWHLATIPLLVQDEAVGALLLVGQLDVPTVIQDAAESCVQAVAEAAVAACVSASSSLVDEFFGTPVSLACAHDVVSLMVAVSTAPDHTAAVRNGAAHIHNLLPRTNLAASGTPAVLAASLSRATSASERVLALLPVSASKPSATHELVVTTGLVISRGTAIRPCTPSNGVTCNTPQGTQPNNIHNNSTNNTAIIGGGPQLHLYHGSSGRSASMLPVSETLITRAPIRADALAAMLNEALAAPVSSAALAAVTARAPGQPCTHGSNTTSSQQQQQQKLLTLRCPEEELPRSQPRADLIALEAAGARAPHGSLVVVSCPLSSIMCAVVVYVCVMPPKAAGVSGKTPNGSVFGVSSGQVGSPCDPGGLEVSRPGSINRDFGAQQPQMPPALVPSHLVQLAEAQLKLILKHASSAVEILASALEQRILYSCALSQARIGSKGPCTVDVTADTSGLVTVSMAGTDGDDSNGFWGSASGPILSGDSIPTSQLSAAAAIPSASPSTSACFSAGRSPVNSAFHTVTDYMKPVRAAVATVAAAAMVAPPVSPLAVSSFPASQITGREVCTTNSIASGVTDRSSTYQTDIGTEKRSVDGGFASGKATASGVVVSRGAEHLKQPGPGATAATCVALELGFVQGPGPAAVDTSLAKFTGIGNRPPGKVPSNDTDVSQDTSIEGAAAGTGLAAVTVTVDAGPRGARSSAATSSSSASGSSGFESTISTLTCDQLGNARSAGRFPPNQRSAVDVPTSALVPTLSKVVQLMVGGQVPAVRTRAMQPGARHLLPSYEDSGNGASGDEIGHSLASHSKSITLETNAVTAVTSASVATAVQQNGAQRMQPTPAGPQAPLNLESCFPPLQGFDSNSATCGGNGVASLNGDQLSRAMVRNRSKDWSDQAGEPEGADSRFVPGGSAGGPAAPRLRPIKVLSLDKAAQQLQRTSGSSLNASNAQQPMPPPTLMHTQQQQQQTQQGSGPQQANTTALNSNDEEPSRGSAVHSGPASAAPPPPYVPYMPRRLNRMYLPAAAYATPGAIGVPLTPASVTAKAIATSRPYASLQTPPSEGAAPPPPHIPHPIQLAVRAIGRDSNAAALGAVAVAVRPIDGQTGRAASAPERAVNILKNTPPGNLFSTASGLPDPALTVPLALSPVEPVQVCMMPPSPLVDEAAAAIAAARDGGAGTGTGTGCPSPSAGSQKSRQLSDFAIPEDTPLEYTVSETVQMMRMLAQARGVHLSSRMRRVRVTAKIQSAHPEALPADLPSQIAKAALAQSVAAGSVNGTHGIGLFANTIRDPGTTSGGAWVLTGIAARRGCVELVFDVVQVRGFHELRTAAAAISNSSQRSSQLHTSAHAEGSVQGSRFSSGAAASAPQPTTPGQAGASTQTYRRWQGDVLAETLPFFDDSEDTIVSKADRAAGTAPKAQAAVAVGEHLWLRNMCGIHPEVVAQVLHDCGLLSPGGDPFVDIQIGHTSAGSSRLLWHESSGQWVATSAAGSAPVSPNSTAGPSASSLEAPTLWLPTAVVLLARGARVLQDIRVVSTVGGNSSRGDVVDELTVRSACGYLPVRTAAGLRLHAGGGSGSGSSVPPLPLLLEDDPVAEALVDGACVWRLVDVGGALPRNGGLLLVECRRTAAVVRGPQELLLDPPHAPAVVTSAPVPLLVLPEQQAAAAAELQRLRVYMARMLLGSEDVLHTSAGPLQAGSVVASAPRTSTRAESAAQVEMACQQFLMDLGVLLDAASSTIAPANGSRSLLRGMMSAPGPSSCPQPGVSTGGGGGGLVGMGSSSSVGNSSAARPPPHSFSEVQSHSKRPQLLELHASPVCTTDVLSSMPSCSSPLTIVGACGVGRGNEMMVGWASEAGGGGFSGGSTVGDGAWSFAEDMRDLMQPYRTFGDGFGVPSISGDSSGTTAPGTIVTEYGEHLIDVACTLLAGCCATGMQCTAVLVLEAACRDLSLATPEMLLAVAGTDPRVTMELLSKYGARVRQGTDDHGRRGGDGGTLRTCRGANAANVTAAADGAVRVPTLGTEFRGSGAMMSDGSARPANFARCSVEWSNTTDGNVAGNSSHSRSHSLAVMLVGSRSSPGSPQTLHERCLEDRAEFGGWQQHANGSLLPAVDKQQKLHAPPDRGMVLVSTEVMSSGDGAITLAHAPSQGFSPSETPVGVEVGIRGSLSSDSMPTWGSISVAGTPDSATQAASKSRPVSNFLGSADMVAVAGLSQDNASRASAAPRVEDDSSAMVAVVRPTQVAAANAVPVSSELSQLDFSTALCATSPEGAISSCGPVRHSSNGAGSGACDGASGHSCSKPSSARLRGPGYSAKLEQAEHVPGKEEWEGGLSWQGSAGVVTAVHHQDENGGYATPTDTSRRRSDRLAGWCMRFSDPAVEAEYMQFVAKRTCGIMWSYFICNAIISAISGTRAWVEDGLDSSLTMLIFSGLPALIMGWYCFAYGARNGRAMVTTALLCKAVRLFSDVLMGWRVLKVPSLMEPMTMRGIEIWSEALMRPMAERIPLTSYCLMTTLELPCVWMVYRHFQSIFPDCWSRSYPLLRALAFILLAGTVNVLAELYWRREFRRCFWRVMAGGGINAATTGMRAVGGATAGEGASLAAKLRGKDE